MEITVKLHTRNGDYVRNAVIEVADPDDPPPVLTSSAGGLLTAYLFNALATENSTMPAYLEVECRDVSE